MIRVVSLIKIVRFAFARKIKSSSLSSEPVIPSSLNSTSPSTLTSVSPLQKQQQNELSDQFQPLSKSTINAYKQKIKSNIVKQLSYQGEDPSPNKLVNRPAKGVVWGLGGQLILADRKVELQGVRDDVEEISKFLELHMVKNIYVHDWKNQQDPSVNRRRYSIIGSCYSARHCWKTAIQLKNAFNKHILHQKATKDKKKDSITASMVGGKDEEWTMVQFKDFQVSLMTQQQRQAVDLQWKWNNPVSEETVEKHVKIDMNRKSRKNQFRNLQ